MKQRLTTQTLVSLSLGLIVFVLAFILTSISSVAFATSHAIGTSASTTSATTTPKGQSGAPASPGVQISNLSVDERQDFVLEPGKM